MLSFGDIRSRDVFSLSHIMELEGTELAPINVIDTIQFDYLLYLLLKLRILHCL